MRVGYLQRELGSAYVLEDPAVPSVSSLRESQPTWPPQLLPIFLSWPWCIGWLFFLFISSLNPAAPWSGRTIPESGGFYRPPTHRIFLPRLATSLKHVVWFVLSSFTSPSSPPQQRKVSRIALSPRSFFFKYLLYIGNPLWSSESFCNCEHGSQKLHCSCFAFHPVMSFSPLKVVQYNEGLWLGVETWTRVRGCHGGTKAFLNHMWVIANFTRSLGGDHLCHFSETNSEGKRHGGGFLGLETNLRLLFHEYVLVPYVIHLIPCQCTLDDPTNLVVRFSIKRGSGGVAFGLEMMILVRILASICDCVNSSPSSPPSLRFLLMQSLGGIRW